MTIFERIAHTYPGEYEKLIKTSKGYFTYLARKNWWINGWRSVLNDEGGNDSLLANIMLRVVEFDFDYEAGFKDYCKELVARHSGNRIEAKRASLSTFSEVASGNSNHEWDDPTFDEVLKDYTSTETGAVAPLGGARPQDATIVVAGGVHPPAEVEETPPLLPLYSTEVLNLMTKHEINVLESFQITGSYKRSAELLGVSFWSVKDALKNARRKARKFEASSN